MPPDSSSLLASGLWNAAHTLRMAARDLVDMTISVEWSQGVRQVTENPYPFLRRTLPRWGRTSR